MKLKQNALAAAVAAVLALGASSQASASVYAGSSLGIDQLSIAFLNAGNTPAVGAVTINSFSFTLTNTAFLNTIGGVNGAFNNTCSGTPGGNSCGVSPVLDANAANAQGGSVTRTNNQVSGADNSFTWFTAGAGGNWSNADSVIYTSELTSSNANVSKTDQIAESLITSASSAAASSEMASTTKLTLNFTVGNDPVNFSLGFLADPDMRAQILNDLGISYSAQSIMSVGVSLSKDGVFGVGFGWNPDGTTTTNNCGASVGITCSETADTQNLNLTLGTSTNNTTSDNSYDPNGVNADKTAFGIYASGLTSGGWTLTLTGKTSTNVTRYAVPEPGMLALMGIGLIGLASIKRRRAA